MTDPTETLSTVNIVASSSLTQEVNLEALAEDLDDGTYDQERFPGLIFKPPDFGATCMVFRSGKILCTGAKSVSATEDAVALLLDAFEGRGINGTDDLDLTIENIVTTGDLDEDLNLHTIAIGFGLENIEYEPEQFPGLVYRPPGLSTVILLFGTGKVVIAGATQAREAEQTIEQVREELSDLDLLE